MKFSDEGIIISVKNYSENSSIVKIFSRHHGIYRGFVKSIKSRNNKVIFQIGNLVSFEFRSRIEENLGSFFAVDLINSYCSKIMFEQLKINCVKLLFSMIDELFLEREEQEILFEKMCNFLQKISQNNEVKFDAKNLSNHEEKAFLADYVRLELEILKTLGYGIDLSSCAATESTTDLIFVSPKSARAVCASAGIPYQKKLLKLPSFLVEEESNFNEENLLEGLALSGFFLEKFLFSNRSEAQKKESSFYRASIKKSLSNCN